VWFLDPLYDYKWTYFQIIANEETNGGFPYGYCELARIPQCKHGALRYPGIEKCVDTNIIIIIIIIINLTLIKPKAMQLSYLGLKTKENLTTYFRTKQDEKP
jgi:hypothetical protein